MLLPDHCVICRRRGASPCLDCRARLRPAPRLPAPPGVDVCTAVLAYEGDGRELLARLKYRNARGSLRWLADQVAASVDPETIDEVTWVPTTDARRRARGFDQAELLARAVARRLGRRCRSMLRRGTGPPQTGHTAEERRAGPSFALRHPHVAERVLLVDDVITTGSSAAAAARTLRAGGCSFVRLAAGARTSLKRAEGAPETQVI